MALEDHPKIVGYRWQPDSLEIYLENGDYAKLSLEDLGFESEMIECNLGISNILFGIRLSGESHTHALTSIQLIRIAKEKGIFRKDYA